jgi:hypothetical protein
VGVAVCGGAVRGSSGRGSGQALGLRERRSTGRVGRHSARRPSHSSPRCAVCGLIVLRGLRSGESKR